jgi:hypothetical protein
MCEYSRRLIAWLDEEIPAEEAAAIERHVSGCSTCREQVVEYRRISEDFAYCCEAVMTSKVGRPSLTWRRAALGAALIAAAVVLVSAAVLQRSHITSPSVSAPSVVAAPPVQKHDATVLEPPRLPDARNFRVAQSELPRKNRLRRLTSVAPPTRPNWAPADAAIEIVIPADAMFPPGAVPPGASFSAVLTIGADGSARTLMWHP